MSQRTSEIRKPSTDDRLLWDISSGMMAGPAVLVAHELKLFPFLAETPRTLSEVCEALHLARRPAEALLAVCVSVGLAHKQDDSYTLTPTAEEYLLDTSPTYFGGFFDLLIATSSLASFESVKRAVLTNTSQVYGGEDLWKSHEE